MRQHCNFDWWMFEKVPVKDKHGNDHQVSVNVHHRCILTHRPDDERHRCGNGNCRLYHPRSGSKKGPE